MAFLALAREIFASAIDTSSAQSSCSMIVRSFEGRAPFGVELDDARVEGLVEGWSTAISSRTIRLVVDFERLSIEVVSSASGIEPSEGSYSASGLEDGSSSASEEAIARIAGRSLCASGSALGVPVPSWPEAPPSGATPAFVCTLLLRALVAIDPEAVELSGPKTSLFEFATPGIIKVGAAFAALVVLGVILRLGGFRPKLKEAPFG